jgi:tripartite-type tricarboxylate transporter receptor subunit TctC
MDNGKETCMRWGIFYLLIIAVELFISVPIGHAASDISYKDTVIRIIVGAPPGGRLDTYSRIIARHMGAHVPGSPTIVIENMPGAGTLLAANYLSKAAKPDGLTFGTFVGNVIMRQVLGQPGVEFDARRFEWIGTASPGHAVCILTKADGITNLEKWMGSKKPVKLGGTGPGSNTDDIPKILAPALGLPLQLVTGYKGTADIRQAAESGELDGLCVTWEAIKTSWRRQLESGDVNVVLQAMPKAHPDLPKVPLAIDYAKTNEARRLIQIGVHDQSLLIQPYAAPPGTAKERVQILRKAFLDTLKHKQFLAEAEKADLEIDPMGGEDVQKMVDGLLKVEPGLVSKLKEFLK